LSATTYGYTFKLPRYDPSVYVNFIDELIFGKNRKDSIMQPVPPAVGQLKFCVVRNKGMMQKLTPSFYLYLEKNNGGKILVLYGKKMPFKKQSYYMICLEKNAKSGMMERDSENCLGKLRANNEHDRFVLYDNGENFDKRGVQFKNLRREHGAFIYRYEPCNVGNIRKMIILFPAIICTRKFGQNDRELRRDGSIDIMTNNNVNNETGDYNPDERQGNEDDGSDYNDHDLAVSIPATSQYYKGLGVKGTRDSKGREIPD
jgi:hypothetical protein